VEPILLLAVLAVEVSCVRALACLPANNALERVVGALAPPPAAFNPSILIAIMPMADRTWRRLLAAKTKAWTRQGQRLVRMRKR
jgi:hypothetical protein